MAGEVATDHEIAALARVQYGVASRAQLVDLGLTRNEIERRVTVGNLHPIHRGVYAVGHTVLKREGHWIAATLATDGVLSHITAATAWGFAKSAGAIHVTVPGDPGRAKRRGLNIHRSRTLTPDDITLLDRIPVTEPHRTITDLARTIKGRPLERAVNLAERLIDFERLRATAPPSLQAVLRAYTTAHTRSELEEMFLRLCDARGLPRPEANVRIEGMECDFVWRDRHLIVEVDGYAFHRSPRAFETDHARDVELRVVGWTVLRFTYEQVTNRPDWVADRIRLAWRSA